MRRTAAILTGLLAITSAHAESDDAGLLFGVGVGQAHAKESFADIDPDLPNFSDGALAGKIMGGYQFNQYFAIEAQYVKTGTLSQGFDEGFRLKGQVDTVGAFVVGAYPLWRTMEIYARAGGWYWDFKAVGEIDGERVVTDTSDDIDFGFGAGLRWTDKSGAQLRLEYERAKFDVTRIRLITVTAAWKF